MMEIGSKGLALIKGYETLRLKAYAATEDERERDIWTIGWGHTAGVKEGDTCTEEEAEAFLKQDLAKSESAVRTYVTAPLSQNQYDALVSFTFNVGRGALVTSTLLKKLNAGSYTGASEEFSKWIRQSGKVLNGLVRRRADEQALFNLKE